MTAALAPPDHGYGFTDAGALATTAVPVFHTATPVGDARRHLRAERYDLAHELVLCEGDRYVAVVGVEELLVADDATPLGSLPREDVPVVDPAQTAERAAWLLAEARAESAAVVDPGGRFLGLIPADRMVQVLVREHEDDLAHLSGFLHDTATARSASTEPVRRRLWHRTPWLLIGLLGAVVAALIVDGFEGSLERNVELAFFLPGIVYLADAVGTQTETLVVRGLSVGVSIRQVVGRELLTGLLLGALLGTVALPIAAVLFTSTTIAVVVAISLFAASAIATGVAMVLPSVLHRVGVDPAYGSGPLATVVQDLLSILIYFLVAAALL